MHGARRIQKPDELHSPGEIRACPQGKGAPSWGRVMRTASNRGSALAKAERQRRGVLYHLVQPYGRDLARDVTVLSQHATAADAFAAIDRLSAQMVRTGAPPDAVELIVVTLVGER